jgi:predicted alpha/beta superfamily hydrolase
MALFCGRERPDVIGRIGAVSPSVMWADFRCFEHWNSKLDTWMKMYIDMGTEERIVVQGIYLDYASIVGDFYDHLMRLGYKNYEVTLNVEEGGRHYEADWARRFPYLCKALLNDD